ncbi:MAG: MoaD/ThiS family protein [Bacillota bacterium]
MAQAERERGISQMEYYQREMFYRNAPMEHGPSACEIPSCGVMVVLHGSLERYAPPGEGRRVIVHLPRGRTVADLIDIIGIPRQYVSFGAVNGVRREMNQELKDGDEVALFTPLSGG